MKTSPSFPAEVLELVLAALEELTLGLAFFHR